MTTEHPHTMLARLVSMANGDWLSLSAVDREAIQWILRELDTRTRERDEARQDLSDARDQLEKYAESVRDAAASQAAGGPLTDSKANAKWLRANRATYEGNWVALKDGELVAAHKSRRALTHWLRVDGRLEGVFLVPIFDDPAPSAPADVVGQGVLENLHAEGRAEERRDAVAWHRKCAEACRAQAEKHYDKRSDIDRRLWADSANVHEIHASAIERGDHIGASTAQPPKEKP